MLTANSQSGQLIEQARRYKPNAVVVADEAYYLQVKEALQPEGIKVYAGERALASIVEMETIDMVLCALVGYSGLQPTLRAVEFGKDIALANKETLVVAGELVMGLAAEKQVNIIPVDSEHSAIFQCLVGEVHNPIEKIILTASGGPFRGRRREQLLQIKPEEALKHPNWDMGAKITIDSATLMNKGLEVIEARWLFDLRPEQIEVVVHPQSIIHSMVQFRDGSMKAQLGLPDMRLPIQYALAFPKRLTSDLPRFNFADYPAFTFEQPDLETFRNLSLAFEALAKKGNTPCVLNAANEVAVHSFLHRKVRFLEIPEIIEHCMNTMPFVSRPTFEDYVETDKLTRIKALEIIE